MIGLWRAFDRLFTCLLWIAVVCGMLMTAFVVLASVMRYFVGQPFRFTEEIVGLLFVALSFLGLPWATLHNRHLRITLIPDMLPPRVRKLADFVAGILVIVFCVEFGLRSWEFAAFSFQLNSRSDMGGIPLAPWMALMPAMCAAAALAILLRRLRPSVPDDEPPPGV